MYSVADPDLELRGVGGFACPAGFFFLLRFFFSNQNRRSLGPPGPSPRSATGIPVVLFNK